MNIASSGMTQVFGGMGLDRTQPNRPATKAIEPTPPVTSRNQNPDGFKQDLLHVRAVQAAPKAEGTQPQPNPNLPRGSMIDLKV